MAQRSDFWRSTGQLAAMAPDRMPGQCAGPVMAALCTERAPHDDGCTMGRRGIGNVINSHAGSFRFNGRASSPNTTHLRRHQADGCLSFAHTPTVCGNDICHIYMVERNRSGMARLVHVASTCTLSSSKEISFDPTRDERGIFFTALYPKPIGHLMCRHPRQAALATRRGYRLRPPAHVDASNVDEPEVVHRVCGRGRHE